MMKHVSGAKGGEAGCGTGGLGVAVIDGSDHTEASSRVHQQSDQLRQDVDAAIAVAPVAAVPKRPQSIIFGGRAFIFKVDLVT